MTTFTIETQTGNTFTVQAGWAEDAVFVAAPIVEEGTIYRLVGGWLSYYVKGGVVYSASTHEEEVRETAATLFDKSVEVAKQLNDLETTFSYKGKQYDLYKEERGTRYSVVVFDTATREKAEGFALSASSYAGN